MHFQLQELHGDRWSTVNTGNDLDALDCQAEQRLMISGASQVRIKDERGHIMPLSKSNKGREG